MSNDANFIAKVYDLENKIGIFKVEFNSINSTLNEIKRQLDQFRQNDYVSNEKHKQSTDSFVKEIEQLKDLIDTLTGKHSQLNGYYCNIIQELSEQYKKTEMHDEKFVKIDSDLTSLKQSLVNQLNLSDANFRRLVNDTKIELGCKIDATKHEFVSSPKSVVDSNLDVVKKVEMAQLDCQNAMLKLGNLETQCRIFERRLENLDIRIKKLELAKQE